MIRELLVRTVAAAVISIASVGGIGYADMLTNAQSFLAWQGVSVPSGYTVRWGTDTATGAPGQVKMNDPSNPSAGGVIVINPEGIKALAPSLTGDVTQFGGVIVNVLYHEIRHANGSFGSDVCSEIRLQNQTAVQGRNLVCLILSEIPAANVNPLCSWHKDAQKHYNVGVATPGGAPTAWSKAGCPGTFPGLIPNCPCCP